MVCVLAVLVNDWPALSRLTAEESALYQGLGNDTYGPAVRLEQELISWDWALERLHPAAG
ncbi:Wadjet anti-phage system protein JetD domain-containing protein [Arthrobacter sp. ISL-5]|uniref:Wadjet anti-phage system protein JetD domain-containing protein n=1 Tax=Arthrobacter sp. ISL-5 TaxID=2819111 RepID=UPI0035A8F0C3